MKSVINPLVSITVAAYNVQEWLEECLDSIACQTFKNFECIVIDDCSSDLTQNIIKSRVQKDPRFRLVRHKINQGLAVVRRTGLAHCTGKYIWQIDGDDYVVADALENLIKVAERDNCDIIRGRFVSVYDDKIDKNNITFNCPEIANTNLDLSYYYLQPHSIWLNIFRKSFLDSIIFPNYGNINLGEDMIFNSLAFAKAETITFSNITMYYYRARPGSYTKTHPSKRHYLEEARAHSITYSHYADFPLVQMDFMLCFTNYKAKWIKDACTFLKPKQAIEIITEYQKVYQRWEPHLAYQLASKNRKLYYILNDDEITVFLEKMHSASAKDIHNWMTS